MDYKQIKIDMEKLGADLHQAARDFERSLPLEIQAEYKEIQRNLEKGVYGHAPLDVNQKID
jgi:hypothetical protein